MLSAVRMGMLGMLLDSMLLSEVDILITYGNALFTMAKAWI